ncbi:tyrosine-type recombinase/integrase [Bacteroides uniformis]|nr:tyrosine-type recombinase/integrase [Bacteroides uniformis]MCO7114692.1 tyrosine-type recombinase/integrase [Bacteroides uniformis]
MTRIKGQLTTADYLPIAEYNRLVRGLEKDGEYLWETYCWLSFCTACRASDVRTLRWKDILGKSTMTRIEQKTKKNRPIKFNRDVQEKNRFLYEMLGQPAPEQYIFLSPRTGKPYSLEYINRLLKVFKVRYRLPIGAFSTHTFRKTFGRYVYELMGRSAEGPDPAQPDIPPFQPGNHPALHRAGAGGHRQSVRFHTSMRIFSTMPGTRAGGSGLCFI